MSHHPVRTPRQDALPPDPWCIADVSCSVTAMVVGRVLAKGVAGTS
ncbi:MAG TPA: hypothetical protein VKY73_00230 [Polyangiaceae bacterium]|nr:hypothetical protein [Polyangiaceae bacterium]